MELEVTFQASEIETIERSVQRNGFEATAKKHQIDHYYIVGETDDDGVRHYFRLREDKRTSENSLDYHRVLSEFETEETEVPINSVEDGREILALLGHDVECVVDKQRTEYEQNGVVVTIDHIDGLGDFVEIELDGALTEEKERRFDELIDQFDLDEESRVKNKGYPELIMSNGQWVRNDLK